MPPNRNSKAKLAFDPNQSDPEDENFAPGSTRSRSRKSTKRSQPPTKKSSQRKRRKRDDDDDSGISDDSNDSEEEDSFSDDLDISEPEPEFDEKTGRPKRQAKAVKKNYVEESDEDPEEEDEEPATKKTKIVKLKANPKNSITPGTARSTRAGSAARSQKPSVSTIRRGTRSTTVDEDDLVQLSTSGRHGVRVSKTPEPQPFSGRSTRASKSVKQPVTITEASHESSSFEHAEDDVPMIKTDIPDVGAPARSIHDSHDEGDNEDDNIADADADADAEADFGVDADMEDKEPDMQVDVDDDEDDDEPVTAKGRSRGKLAGKAPAEDPMEDEEPIAEGATSKRRLTRKSGKGKDDQEQFSDFEPDHEPTDDDLSGSDASLRRSKRALDDDDESPVGRGRSARLGKSKSNQSSRRRRGQAESDSDNDQSPEKEAFEELQDLTRRQRRRPVGSPNLNSQRESRRTRAPVNYRIPTLADLGPADEIYEENAATPSRNARRADANRAWDRSWATTLGPFGGAGGLPPVVGGPWAPGAVGGAESDSSDDEGIQRPTATGGNTGMTPTSAVGPGLLPAMGQTHTTEIILGTPAANVGRVKSAKALADADPLGVDANVDFSKVGGLEGHINQLKEMVQMPLLYPEVFMKLGVTPPRGVLFHGPPGTGKTLLARALAASVSSGGKKVSFYMRKGADALSKWVGEAEKSLRLLFEEARRTQPSIIFFDEIDGLAPVRSSKQEQIHASIVSTLLALMDGMDGRGQVIVIGATNRPDNIDPALRRPGRFDREFYFPLPELDARLSIINIHTRDWGISHEFKRSLANMTKGYGGADLRALCTEAALNAVQRTFPQIYSSDQRLVIDTDKIKISAQDFMISIKKMVPSSERSTSSGAEPLPKTVEPLLREQLKEIENLVDDMVPMKKKITALEEAMFEQYDDGDSGFSRLMLQQEFERAKIFRPRLLIKGSEGMGQGYLGGALLNHFEGLHVQNFDLPTIYTDSTRSPEAAIVQLFAEVKRHKPSVVYLPGIDTWYKTVSESVITTFLRMLNSIATTDPILVLGITDTENLDPELERIFAFSSKSVYPIQKPSEHARKEFFSKIVEYTQLLPKDFPDPANRKKRDLEKLDVAEPPPPPPPHIPSPAEIKEQRRKDHQILNQLKLHLQPIMDQLKKKYRKFHNPAIPRSQYPHVFQEANPDFINTDLGQQDRAFLGHQERAYEVAEDEEGCKCLKETATGDLYWNLELTTIEERLSNGYYCRPQDFVKDIKHLSKDNQKMGRKLGDADRWFKAREMLVNVEVDVDAIEKLPYFIECENVYQRRIKRGEEKKKKADADLAIANPGRAIVRGDAHVSGTHASSAIPNPEGIAARSQAQVLMPWHSPAPTSNGHELSYSSEAQNPHLSNGSSVPSENVDIEMSGTDNRPFEDQSGELSDSQHMRPPPAPLREQWPTNILRDGSNVSGHATGFNTQQSSPTASSKKTSYTTNETPRSSGAWSNVPVIGRSLYDTTTSGEKTSGNRTSQSSDVWSNAAAASSSAMVSSSNAWSTAAMAGSSQQSDSQLPDTQPQRTNPDDYLPSTQFQSTGANSQEGINNTQGSSADDLWSHSQTQGMLRGSQTGPSNIITSDSQPNSQQPATPAFSNYRSRSQQQILPPPVASVGDIENSPHSSGPQLQFSQPNSSPAVSSQRPILNGEDFGPALLQHLVAGTDGCTVEMLEQVYRELMVELWKFRGEYQRVGVGVSLLKRFYVVIREMKELRGLENSALESEVLARDSEEELE